MYRKYHVIDGKQICKNCNINKPVEEFSTSKNQITGYCPTCKNCYNELQRARMAAKRQDPSNHEKMKLKEREYRKRLHTERPESHEIRKQNCRKYREEHKDELKEYKRNWDKENFEYISELNRKWVKDNPERSRQHKRKYEDRMMATHPGFAIRKRLKCRLKKLLTNLNVKKSLSTLELCGCSIDKLKEHIESQFTEGMSWEEFNNSRIHIDHRTPCCSYDLTKEDEQRKCFHYTNLQPLWAEDNLSKATEDKKLSIYSTQIKTTEAEESFAPIV